MRQLRSGIVITTTLALLGFFPFLASAAVAPGDLDGNGTVDTADEALFQDFYGSQYGDSNYDPAADLNADGAVDVFDLALFGENFGTTGGDIDVTPPSLFVTLNDTPDDMNDLLVVPPEGFQVTLGFDGNGSVIDFSSLVVTSSLDMGTFVAGTNLASQFSTDSTRAVWTVPDGSNLEPTSHYLTVSIRDAAGNQSNQVYGFAVREFAAGGPPLENQQIVFLDFDQDRSLTTEIDFLEDLRHYHLSSAVDLTIESEMRDWIVAEILLRVHPYFGRNPDGSAGPDAVNLTFTDTDPGGLRSRLCVGGTSSQGGSFLGSAFLDVNNAQKGEDSCLFGSFYGIFPQAIDDLWGSSSEFLAAFGPLDPALGGTPVGEHALDAAVFDIAFDPGTAPAEQAARWADIANATDAFTQLLATVIAHETGHMVGLVPHGDAPAGLYGGTVGAAMDHNVSVAGATPAANYLMNAGGSFSFDAMTGRNGNSLPVFRGLNWAYLHDRVVLDSLVTGLYPAPMIQSVSPDPLVYNGGSSSLTVTLDGDGFLATPVIRLYLGGNPPAKNLLSETFVDEQRVIGYANPILVPPGLYDVELTNPDGQVTTLVDGLLVQP